MVQCVYTAVLSPFGDFLLVQPCWYIDKRQTDTDTCLTVSFPQQPGKPTPTSEAKICVDFNEARDDRMALASAGPYANHLPLAADR